MDRRELRRKRKQDQVREEILAAAGHVLLEKGLGGFTLTAVARELQLTKAALYHYFPAKDALVFALIYRALDNHSRVVGDAVQRANGGADALAALIRSSADHYGERMDELRLAYMVPQVGSAGASPFDDQALREVRPFNERMYGAVADKIARDQAAGRIAKDVDGRRLAFLAHMSVLGMLTIEGVIEASGDSPLIHGRQAMVDELVRTYRARLSANG